MPRHVFSECSETYILFVSLLFSFFFLRLIFSLALFHSLVLVRILFRGKSFLFRSSSTLALLLRDLLLIQSCFRQRANQEQIITQVHRVI